jgi:hypothetical protein
VEGDGFSVFLDLVGSGRGPGARVRRWSALVFILMLILGGFAVYMWLGTVPRKATVAEFEAGLKGNTFRWRTRSQGLVFEIAGYLVDSEAVPVTQYNGRRWIYAPLVSEPGTGKAPRLYFAASEQSYERARAEKRYVGILKPYAVPSVRSQLAAAGVTPAFDTLFLEDSGTVRGAAASSFSLMVFALVGGLVSLMVFFMAVRRGRENADDDVPSSVLPPAPLPDRPNERV